MSNQSNLTIDYVNVGDQPPESSDGLTLAIRTDARHATAGLKKNLIEHLAQYTDPAFLAVHFHLRVVID